MLNVYDKVLKNHISSFLKVGKKSIRIIGVQNEDSQEELMVTQEGLKTDTLSFPIITLIRLPDIEITDDAGTKRASTYTGFLINTPDSPSKVSLTCMRCTLSYYIDIYAENRKVVEDIGMQLFFKLRTHPNINVLISLPIKDADGNDISVKCVPDIILDKTMSHVRSQNLESAQLYKFRIKLELQNVNIYDFEFEELCNIEYKVLARLSSESEYLEI